MKRWISLSVVLLGLGCMKINYANGPQSGVSDDVWRHRVLYGIIEVEGALLVQEVCPQGYNYIHSEVSILNGLSTWALSAITGGLGALYNPSTITVWCKNGQAYRGEWSEDSLEPRQLGQVRESLVEDAFVQLQTAD